MAGFSNTICNAGEPLLLALVNGLDRNDDDPGVNAEVLHTHRFVKKTTAAGNFIFN